MPTSGSEGRGWFHNLTGYFVFLLLTSTTGPLLFGFHLAELNGPQNVLTCAAKHMSTTASLSSLPQCIPMDALQIGVVSSIFTIGGLVGALVAGPSGARYGRLKTMRFTTIFFTLGPILEAAAPNVGVMALGRLISGFGAGAAVVIVPLYISETAPPKQKGFFGSFTQVMINMGIFIAQLLGLFLSKGRLWRIILAVGGAIGLLQLTGLLFAVESPKWLADHGSPAKAKRDLKRIRGHTFDIQEEVEGWGIESSAEMDSEEQALLHNEDRSSSLHSEESNKAAEAEKQTIGFFKVLVHPKYSRATIAVMVVMVAQQLCGINSIVMYGVSLLSDLLTTSAGLLNVAVALLNLIVTLSCAPLIDLLGRRYCLLLSVAGMGTSSFFIAIAISHSIPIMTAIFVLLFVGFFGLGIGPVPFILSSELVGPEAVGATQSWALAANWIATFVVAQFFPVVNEALGKGRVYYVFAGIALLTLAFVYWCVPETKGKKTAEEVWGRNVHAE